MGSPKGATKTCAGWRAGAERRLNGWPRSSPRKDKLPWLVPGRSRPWTPQAVQAVGYAIERGVIVTKAYVISEVEVLDEQAADDYRRLATASITEYGGSYLVRGRRPKWRRANRPSGKSSSRSSPPYRGRTSGRRRPPTPRRCGSARRRWSGG